MVVGSWVVDELVNLKIESDLVKRKRDEMQNIKDLAIFLLIDANYCKRQNMTTFDIIPAYDMKCSTDVNI